jgi:hypothetical protein
MKTCRRKYEHAALGACIREVEDDSRMTKLFGLDLVPVQEFLVVQHTCTARDVHCVTVLIK